MSAALVQSDATAIPLGDNTVDLIVTSPPYFALRSYQDGGEHYGGQIGSEATPAAFLEALWAVTAECWRVLKPSGSLFVNLGDKYAGGGGQWAKDERDDPNHLRMGKTSTGGKTFGFRAKSLMGLPWRYAIGCIDPEYRAFEQWRALGRRADPDYPDTMMVPDEWAFEGILRSEIVWSKPNGMPESVTDRVRRSHEQFFHLTKEGRYFSNVDEVREPHETPLHSPGTQKFNADRNDNDKGDRIFGNPLGKLPGSVWTVPTQPLIVPDWLDVDHFAAFPTEWPRRIILGWSPPGICVECGEGRRAVAERTRTKDRGGRKWNVQDGESERSTVKLGWESQTTITGQSCACDQPTAPTTPAVVLDPFSGTGTVAGVARALGRFGVGLDLSADYLKLAKWRIWESDLASKVRGRSNADAQGVLL